MTPTRLIQNFQGFRAIVVSPAVPDVLRATLTRLGLDVEHVHEQSLSAVNSTLLPERDVVIIDGDPGLPVAFVTAMTESRLPVPVIGLVGSEAPSRLRMLTEAGATAFLHKPVHGGAVYSSLYLGINTFRRRQQAEDFLADNEKRRRGRRHLVKAILLMMQREAMDDETAFDVLRRAAMRSRLGIEDFCEAWLRDNKPASSETCSAINTQERDRA